MIGKRILVAILALAGGQLAGLGHQASAQSFDGITIIELADEAGENAIRGRGRIGPANTGNFIVTFVSAQGAYATLVSSRSDRLCVAWAIAGSYAGTSIAFGLPASTASMTMVSPKICQPFTLTYTGPETVRVEARNRFHKDQGPLSPAAEIVTYSRERPVVARIPLVAFDWGSPIFERHDVKGVRLGPLPAVEALLGGRARIAVGELRRQMMFQKTFEAVIEDRSGDSGSKRVQGHVAAKEILGWPWDALYGTWFAERVPPSRTEAFAEAVFERYGPESLREPERFLWAYDLSGRQLTAKAPGPAVMAADLVADAAAPNNCLATAGDWIGGSGLFMLNQDIGPWGCALIMTLTHDGGSGIVSEYRIEAVSGYTLALNHFFTRLEEMREARKKIQTLESQKPEF